MQRALWHLLDDYLWAVVFLIAYGASGSLRGAIAVAVLVSIVPQVWRALHRRSEPLQWLSLGLVLALAAAALATRSPRCMMARPSAVHFGLAAIMSRGGWMLRYLNQPARRNVASPAVAAAGYAWAVLMAALGLTNLLIALYFDLATWAWFVLAISPGAKIAALALQFAVFRRFVRRQTVAAVAGDSKDAD